MGLVVEGQNDEEQPETLIGCARMFKIDPKEADTIEPLEKESD